MKTFLFSPRKSKSVSYPWQESPANNKCKTTLPVNQTKKYFSNSYFRNDKRIGFSMKRAALFVKHYMKSLKFLIYTDS